MIQFIQVKKKYVNGVTGLDNVSLDIQDGEFVFVIGKSGAGKSTFLKMINLQERPSAGKVKIDELDLTKLRRRKVPAYRRRLGVIFQDFKLLPKLTVYQNVAFAVEAMGESRAEIDRKTLEALELVGLRHKSQAYPNQLSGGEQQRIAIARAIVNDPDIIIADEPTGNLDPETSLQIVEVLRKLNASGKTVLMATHDYELIFESGCRVITVSQGQIVNEEVRASC